MIRIFEVEEGDLISWMFIEEREKVVLVKLLILGKINLNGFKNSIVMVESVKEVKVNEV